MKLIGQFRDRLSVINAARRVYFNLRSGVLYFGGRRKCDSARVGGVGLPLPPPPPPKVTSIDTKRLWCFGLVMVMKIVEVEVVFQTRNVVGRIKEQAPGNTGKTVALLREMQTLSEERIETL